jgi:hypothetical protein
MPLTRIHFSLFCQHHVRASRGEKSSPSRSFRCPIRSRFSTWSLRRRLTHPPLSPCEADRVFRVFLLWKARTHARTRVLRTTRPVIVVGGGVPFRTQGLMGRIGGLDLCAGRADVSSVADCEHSNFLGLGVRRRDFWLPKNQGMHGTSAESSPWWLVSRAI